MPILLYLGFYRGASKTTRIDLYHLIQWACGYDLSSSTRRDIYLMYARRAIGFLQEEGFIGDIIDMDTGEIVNIDAVNYTHMLEFSTDNMLHLINGRFVKTSFEEYSTLISIQKKSVPMFWKSISLYSYIKSKMRYDVALNAAGADFWMFTTNSVTKELGEGFSRNTVQDLFNTLKAHELIYWENGYLPKTPTKKATSCIGRITILNKGEPLEYVVDRFNMIQPEALKSAQVHFSTT